MEDRRGLLGSIRLDAELGPPATLSMTLESVPGRVERLDHAVQCSARHRQAGWGALLLGSAIFMLLWILNTPFREVYVPNSTDIPALADGLLLTPGAHWRDWFTRGYANFWDAYPEWPAVGVSAFTRPAFQLVIYLAHFALGQHWASYQIINCFAVAGMAAVAFLIAQKSLELRTGPALLAAVLVMVSPPVLDSWLYGVAYAIEPLATLLVAGAFLAVVARRDSLCLAFLSVAVFMKENALWATVAAAITIMLRPKSDEPFRRRTFAAAAMFLPVVMWLGLRYTFFGGIGGTYATVGYTPFADFVDMTIRDKLTHLHTLFVTRYAFVTEGTWALPDRAARIGMALLIYALLLLWVSRTLPEMMKRLRSAMHETHWSNAGFLVTLWAAIAFAFHFALPLNQERYATSVVVFAWPALVAEVERRRHAILWFSLVVCCIVSLTRGSYRSVSFAKFESEPNNYKLMVAMLRQLPTATRQVYIVNAGGLQVVNPEHARLVLGVSAEIVRVIDIDWKCSRSGNFVAFDHNTLDGVVNMTVTLPTCAHFRFESGRFNDALTYGHLYRSDTMSYELPEAHPSRPTNYWAPPFYFGRRMTVHVRPSGAARFIIEHGGPNGIVWFDIP
jgi:hypothetical protein